MGGSSPLETITPRSRAYRKAEHEYNASVTRGQPDEVALRRMARHLHDSPDTTTNPPPARARERQDHARTG